MSFGCIFHLSLLTLSSGFWPRVSCAVFHFGIFSSVLAYSFFLMISVDLCIVSFVRMALVAVTLLFLVWFVCVVSFMIR